MKAERRRSLAMVLAWVLAFAGHTVVARVDVRVERDKTFDFKTIRSWGWHPTGPGDVKMARTQNDDPDAIKRIAEPLILDAVEKEMARLKLPRASSDPDLTVRYYLLLSTSFSSQTMGQFLPPVAAWGLPVFAPATQSLKYMNSGSLGIDLSAKDTVIWRGLAQTELQPDTDYKKREQVVRDAVRDLLRRYPKGS
jgi:Domain of unknown function (DUF4136)